MGFDAKTLAAAAELGVRLEVVNGLAIWEAQPVYRHQKAVERIARTPRRGDHAGACTCTHALGVYVQFPAGLKRPDISIFRREPDDSEQDAALTMCPEAVIEVVSRGFEAKDLELGPAFYLSQGVKDVVVFDPTTLLVLTQPPGPPLPRRKGGPSSWPRPLAARACGRFGLGWAYRTPSTICPVWCEGRENKSS